MSKKEEEKEARRLEELLDAILPNVEELSSEEVDAVLADDGDLLRETRAALRDSALELAAAHRSRGHAAPKALTRFAEAMDDRPNLSADPAAAESKAMSLMRSLAAKITSPLGQLQLLEAYRKGDEEFSQRDRELLDAATARLKKKLERDGSGTE